VNVDGPFGKFHLFTVACEIVGALAIDLDG